MTDEMVEYCESFRPEPDLLRAFPKGLVDEIEGKVIEDYPLIVRNRIHRTLPKTYRTLRTRRARLGHCALLMDGWQHRAAFGWCPKSSLRNLCVLCASAVIAFYG